MTKIRRVGTLIVGGGIGGLSAALALSRQGIPAHVLEKAPQFREIGAGIQLAPNASYVLDRLGVLEEVRKDSFFPNRLVLMDALSGSQITAMDVGDKFVERFGYPYFVVHRGDLLDALFDACRSAEGVTLEASKDVVAVESRPDRAVVSCADGSVYEARALVGADGLWSTTRRLLVDDSPPLCAGYVAYRGTIPMDKMTGHAGLDELNDMVIWTGPELHFVHYPVRRGELCNLVVSFRSKRYTVEAEDSDDWGTEEELDAAFDNPCEQVRDGIRLINRDRRWPIRDRLPADTWSRDRTTLLGDAAHAMYQFVAQGAAQAMEDALVLAESLAAFGDDVPGAFAAYQRNRYPRTARVQWLARRFGEILHVGGIGADLRTALLSQRATDDYEIVDWLYGYRAGLHDPAGQVAGSEPRAYVG
jgi:3-hydroxybenzoate 6-monooxygenase